MSNKMITDSKIILAVMGALATAGVSFGQSYTPTYSPVYAPAPPVAPAPQPVYYTMSAQQIDQLVGPIALYPDPLLSEVLAAATYPQDVAGAAQWLQSFPTPTEEDINAQPWDASIKALVHYPTVLQMMASQPDWTASLGAAFANQPQDVMNSVQRLRAEAIAAKTLASTPQQDVVNDGGTVEILPAQPNVIYVPEYNPDVVYVGAADYGGPFITFGVACDFGVWLNLGFDWHSHQFHDHVDWFHDPHHRPDFGRGPVWRHNPSRPIPVPHYPVERPHGVDPQRGFGPGDDHRPAGAFDRGLAPRNAPGGGGKNERPVSGVPARGENAPRAAPPAPPHVEERAAPPLKQVPIAPRPGGSPGARPTERPVEGLPKAEAPAPRQAPAPRPEPMPAPRPAPEPRPAPAPAPQPRPAPEPAPAFHGGGGASIQSDRGHASMHR